MSKRFNNQRQPVERPRKGGWAYSRNKEYGRRDRRHAERDIRSAIDGDFDDYQAGYGGDAE